MFNSRQVTEDGLERTFMVNHLSCFALTLGLKGSLAAARGARVVNTASFGHRGQAYDRTDLQLAKNYSSTRAYGRSKLYNILFTRELARRWKSLGITANCFSPGMVATNFGSGELGWLEPVSRVVGKLFGKSPEEGSKTLVYLASSYDASSVSGEYFTKCRIDEPSAEARNDAAGADLWQQSFALAGLKE
jgi:NAD(P)-dependent dehydrogenase (short-subunit alcohol dehydrogenase family)